MPSLTAVTVCPWMKTADTGNEGTPLSYAVSSGRDNELVFMDYRNFRLWVGNGDRYKHVQAWHIYLRLSLHWVQLNTVRYIQDFFTDWVCFRWKRTPDQQDVLVLIVLILRSRSGAVVRVLASHQCGLGSIWAWFHMWVEFVFRQFSPCSEGFVRVF